MFFESFKMAISSILANKSRSFLTVLGVIIGVGSVVLMLGLGEGVKKAVSETVEGFGTNSVFVVPGKVDKNKPFNPATTIGVSTLTEKDVDALKEKADKVKNIAPMTLIGGILGFGGKTSSSALTVSTTPLFAKATNMDIEKGRFISDEDLQNKSKVVVIGAGIKEDLFGDQNPIDQTIKFRNLDFKVVGYFKKPKQSLQFGDASFSSLTVIPRTTGVDITGTSQIFRIVMAGKTSESVKDATEQARQIILDNHQRTEDFTVLTQDDLVSIAGSILNLLTLLVVSIAAISLVVGGIGIMNMMLVTVTERTKEVGIRKAVGASNADILIQFLIESVVISLLGGLLGILLAFSLGTLISKLTSLSPVINLNFILIAFSISFVIGVVFGLAPAIKASRKDPIEALRYE